MNSIDKEYFKLLKHLLIKGVKKTDRTGTGTISIFDYTIRFNMSEGFPLLTSKKMFTKGIIHELIWFLRGDTNIKYLVDNDCHIWNGDAYKNYQSNHTGDLLSKDEFIDNIKSNNDFSSQWGDLGPVYGKQWRNYEKYEIVKDRYSNTIEKSDIIRGQPIDQIRNLINDLKNNPDSRRLIVSAWNVSDIDNMVLPPCHYGFQCYTTEMNIFERKKYWCDSIGKSIHYAEDLENSELDSLNVPKRKLSLKWTQRSVDTLLGLPFNIASYGLLLELLAKEVNMVADDIIFSGGDVHLYSNHIEQAKEQLTRETFTLSKLVLKNDSIDSLKYEDIEIVGYKSSEVLKAKLSN